MLRLGFWPEATVELKNYNVSANGTSDDAAAIQRALNDVSALGGGTVVAGPHRYLIDSADLVVPSDCRLLGQGAIGGERLNADYTSLPFCLVVNPTYTVRTSRGSRVENLNFVRKGLTAPTDFRSTIQELANFSGTGITIGDGSTAHSNKDATVRDCFILGFSKGISASKGVNNVERLRIENIYGDCLSGIYLSDSSDTTRLRNIHFNGYLTIHQNWILTSYAVSGAVNNGSGLIRLTVTGHPFVTGDSVPVANVGGITVATGRWVVTKIDANTIDLQSSSFSGSYTSGGTAYADAGYRSGTGLYIDKYGVVDCSNVVMVNFATGYDIGTTGSTDNTFVQCHCDGSAFTTGDISTIGVRLRSGGSRTKWFGGFLNGHGTVIKSENSVSSKDSFFGCSIGAAGYRVIDHGGLKLGLVGCYLGSGIVYVATAATSLRLTNCDIQNITKQGQTTADLEKIVSVNDDSTKSAIHNLISYGRSEQAHTGDTNETVLATISVPANSMGPNGELLVDMLWRYVGTANTKPMRIRQTNVSGTVLWQFTAANTQLSGRMTALIVNRGAIDSQYSTGIANAGFGTTANDLVSTSIDTTAVLTLVITGALTNGSDSIALESYSAIVRKPSI